MMEHEDVFLNRKHITHAYHICEGNTFVLKIFFINKECLNLNFSSYKQIDAFMTLKRLIVFFDESL
jgi:hypothetical protein